VKCWRVCRQMTSHGNTRRIDYGNSPFWYTNVYKLYQGIKLLGRILAFRGSVINRKEPNMRKLALVGLLAVAPIWADTFVYSTSSAFGVGCMVVDCSKGRGQSDTASFNLSGISGVITSASIEVFSLAIAAYAPPVNYDPGPPHFPEPRSNDYGLGIYGGSCDSFFTWNCPDQPLYQVWQPNPCAGPFGTNCFSSTGIADPGLAAMNTAIGGTFSVTFAAVNLPAQYVEYWLWNSGATPDGSSPVRLRLEIAPEPTAWLVLATLLVAIPCITQTKCTRNPD
jgi:hypothetical protein